MDTEKLDMQSPDLVNENFEKLAALFPNCVTEGAEGKAIDFDLLKQELSHAVVEGNKERYRIEWPGKREAIVTANLPTTKTLRPVREDSVDFDNTENLYIEGDNLEVLKLLQESYLGKIKMIYIDPPYNTGKDFVYKDNFSKDAQEELIESGQKDEYNQRLIANPETAGRYHSDWLSMMYPRLKLSRTLLGDNGVIFISIGNEELQNLKSICDEIYGETNFITILGRLAKKGGASGRFFSPNVEFLLVYAKKIDALNPFKDEMDEKLIKKVYTNVQKDGERKGEYYRTMGLYQSSLTLERSRNARYFIECPDGDKVIPPEGKRWRVVEESFIKMLDEGNIEFKETNSSPLFDENGNQSKWNIYTKIWLKDREEEGMLPNDFIDKYENRLSSKELQKLGIPFDFAKPTALIKYLAKIIDDKNSIVLDFFAGSSTTADALIQLNSEDEGERRFIQVQLPELTGEKSEAYRAGYKNICEIGKERIRRAAKKIKEETNADIDYGFRVYRLDSSNMQDVYYKPQDYDQNNLELFADNVKPDRTADDLLAQVMLDWGLPLSLKIEQLDVSGKKVFKVAENSLYACFDSGIDEDFAKAIAKDEPLRIVFKDSGFKNDTAKTNVKQLLKQLSPETEMKVI
ncbi:site-specific DNA-methyltransferase [Cyclobacterium xiamenense]|uniref:site-specific DNA-methyltransferase n=1 Tax=Cyclobacterium xiamenense TaxID=1297121 RepID=UPI0035D10F31